MNHSIKPGVVPPSPALDREEPELAEEEDIPSDDDSASARDEGADGDARPDVHRE